jgi:hypothetical protein
MKEVFEFVYCPGCNQTVKYAIDLLPAVNAQDHKAQDIVCPQCYYIIATFHERIHVPQASNN